MELYERAGFGVIEAVKGVVRLGIAGHVPRGEIRPWMLALAKSVQDGDFESTWYLSYMYREGIWIRRDSEKAERYMQRACDLGFAKACEVLAAPEWPIYTPPPTRLPDWATAFPLQRPVQAAPQVSAGG